MVTALATTLEPVLAELEEARTAADGGELAEAHDHYAAAVQAFAAAQAAAAAQAVHLGKAAADQLPELPAVPIEQAPRVSSAGPIPVADQLPTLGSLRRQERLVGLALTIVVFLVALLVGLATLYFNDPTWGGPEDIIAALLWGLGLTAAGTAAGFAGSYTAVTR